MIKSVSLIVWPEKKPKLKVKPIVKSKKNDNSKTEKEFKFFLINELR